MSTLFSSRTITLLQLTIVEGYSFGNIIRIFKISGVPIETIRKYDITPRTSKSELVANTLDVVQNLEEKERNFILYEIMAEILIHQSWGPQYQGVPAYTRSFQKLLKSLTLDNFEISEDMLVPIIDKEVAKEETVLEVTLEKHGFGLVKHHLSMSNDHFVDGEWDSANSQTRKTLEALTQKIAEQIANHNEETIPQRHEDVRPFEVRNYLKDTGFLDSKEHALLNAFYQYASDSGAHPGLSNETDARVRRFILIGLCQFYLEKFEGYIS